MSVFHRRKSSPPPSSLSSYRSLVRQDFSECCAYCLLHELLAAGAGNFELDHFRPQSLFPSLARFFHTAGVCEPTAAGSGPTAPGY